MSGSYIRTYTGRKFWPLNPRLRDIDIQDIAAALSHLCRFNGHVREFYSVAEHSVRVSWLAYELGGNNETALCGLMHDATEAYLTDLPRPIKHQPQLSYYRESEGKLWKLIAKKFKLPEVLPDVVHLADNRLLVTEMRDLKTRPDRKSAIESQYEPLPSIIKPWDPVHAHLIFLIRYKELTEPCSSS